MSDILGTLGYTAGQLVQAKVQANNIKGWSTPSEPNTGGEKAKSKPIAPTISAAVALTNTSISLTWNVITSEPDNGYSPVTGYRIYWNGTGNGNQLEALNTSTTNSATISDLTTGVYYNFAITAFNIYDESLQSTTAAQQASIKPDTIAAPTLNQSGKDIVIAWTPPNANGESIDSYEVLLYDRSGNSNDYVEHKSLCNGTDFLDQASPS